VDIQQISVKVLAAGADRLDLAELIPIFHGWIRERRLPHRLLIDVADYRHVHEGPGVMLIAHECHIGLDRAEGRPGLLYTRRRDPLGPAGDKLEEALRDALLCCRELEGEPALAGALRFDGGALRVEVQSRLAAPSTAETFAAFRPAIEPVLARLYAGAPFEIAHRADARAPFGVDVRAAAAPPVAELLERLGGT
jgi:hypothetical protein